MKKIIIFLSAALLSFHSTFAKGDLADLKKRGSLKIAVDTTYPPMEYENDKGEAIGFDVDMAKELAKRLGVKADFIVMPWDGILAGLAGKRYDVIISSMNITEDRLKAVNFVEYVKMGQIFISRKTDDPVVTVKDLRGKVVAVQRDTTSSEAVDGFAKKVKIKDIKTFVAATDAFSALKSRQADVIVIDEPVGNYYVALDAKTFVVTGEAIAPEPIGIAIRKADSELYAEISKQMAEMKKDGSFDKIYKKWFGANPKK